MQDGKSKRSRNLRRQRTVRLASALRTYGVAALSVALACSVGLAAWHMFGKLRVAEAGAADAKWQLAQAEAQEAQVKQDIQTLSTPQGTQEALRQQYGVAEPGEGVIEILQSSSTPTATPPTARPGFFARIWQAIISW